MLRLGNQAQNRWTCEHTFYKLPTYHAHSKFLTALMCHMDWQIYKQVATEEEKLWNQTNNLQCSYTERAATTLSNSHVLRIQLWYMIRNSSKIFLINGSMDKKCTETYKLKSVILKGVIQNNPYRIDVMQPNIKQKWIYPKVNLMIHFFYLLMNTACCLTVYS